MPVRNSLALGCLLSLLAAGAGCRVARQLCATLGNECKYHRSERRLARQESVWADQVQGMLDSESGEFEGPDFPRGFRDGFIAATHTGNAEPPPVPPESYWQFRGKCPPDHDAAAQWYAGFRAGAMMAAEWSYRDCVVVPTEGTKPAVPPVTEAAQPATPVPQHLPDELPPLDDPIPVQPEPKSKAEVTDLPADQASPKVEDSADVWLRGRAAPDRSRFVASNSCNQMTPPIPKCRGSYQMESSPKPPESPAKHHE